MLSRIARRAQLDEELAYSLDPEERERERVANIRRKLRAEQIADARARGEIG